MTKTPLVPYVDQVRIRSGQRRLIFAVATAIGLRDEQLYDLIEASSDYRTRAIARLTIGEARRLTGILKRMERAGGQLPAAPPPAPMESAAVIRAAVRRVRPRSA